jgi:hypothetical protein
MVSSGPRATPATVRTCIIRMVGRVGLFASRRRTLPAILLHTGTGLQHILVDNDCKVTDHVLVKLERLLELRNDVRGRLVKDLHIESCVLLPDRVCKTPSSPTICGCYYTTVLRDEFLITSNYRLYLTVFQVGIDDKCRFVFSLNDVQFNSPPLVI